MEMDFPIPSQAISQVFQSIPASETTKIIRRRQSAGGTKLFGGGLIRGAILPNLLNLIQNSNVGASSDEVQRLNIKQLIDELGNQNEGFMSADPNLPNRLSGKWKLLWTTEKETLLFKSKGFFGSAVTEISLLLFRVLISC